jgi:hypothetical protein
MTEQAFTPEQEKIIADLLAKAMAAKPAKKAAKAKKPGRKPLTEEQKATNRAKTDEITVKKFTAKGYKDVQPRVNVMTYGKWNQAGRQVIKGQKATVCGSFALFHRDQTEAIGPVN